MVRSESAVSNCSEPYVASLILILFLMNSQKTEIDIDNITTAIQKIHHQQKIAKILKAFAG